MNSVSAVALSLAVLAAFALTAGGAWLIAKRVNRKQGVLMLVMAAVLIANVLVWTV
jgi:hypothetical protein